jgi:hypothetical protein
VVCRHRQRTADNTSDQMKTEAPDSLQRARRQKTIVWPTDNETAKNDRLPHRKTSAFLCARDYNQCLLAP